MGKNTKIPPNDLAFKRLETHHQQLSVQKVFLLCRALSMVVRTVVWAGVVIFIFWTLKEILVSYAGEETDANIVINLLGELKAPEWVAYLFGGSGIVFGGYERRARKKAMEVQSAHSAKLEKHFDKSRRSSKLNPDGRNRREDLR